MNGDLIQRVGCRMGRRLLNITSKRRIPKRVSQQRITSQRTQAQATLHRDSTHTVD